MRALVKGSVRGTLLAVAVAGFLTMAPAPANARAATSAAVELAERYSPVLMVQPQPHECGPGEAYRPANVDILLGRQGVVLRDAAGRVVKSAPTATDLFDRGAGYYLDFPGNPLRPGCGYEREYRRWNGDHKPVIYAHLAVDPEHPGRLALQYWLFYTFNDFTGKHEGDWEMVQVDFEAIGVTEALARGPYEVDVAQHEGGERAAWNDRELRKDETHPVLYVATGSHATYFGQALYLGRSGHEGFGCDNTSRATEAVSPQVEQLPGVPDSAAAPDAWVAFEGLWGERKSAFNNGPTGPADKDQWSHPIEWADGLRDNSVPVPGTKTLGPTVTNFFCNAVTQSSVALNWGFLHPGPFLLLLGLVVVAFVVATQRTTWRPPDPYPVRASRRGGQILRASWRLYAGHVRTFVALGAIFVPISLLAAGVQWLLFHPTGLAAFVALDGRRGAVTALFALLIGDIGAAFATVLATAAVAVVLGDLAAERHLSARQAIRTTRHRLGPLAAGALTQYAVVLLLTLTVVGIPLAVYGFIRWSLFTQACMLDSRGGLDSLARSSLLVRGRWWRTFGFTVVVDVLAVLSGLVVGIALLLLTPGSLSFIDITSSLVYTLTVPFAAIALTLYYFELECAPDELRPPILSRPSRRPARA